MLQPKLLVSDKSPAVSLFNITVNLILGFFLIGPMVGLGVASIFYEGDLFQDITAPQDMQKMFYPLLIMQGIASLVSLIALPLLHIKTIERKRLQPFFPSQSKVFFALFITSLIALNFIVSISPITEWNAHIVFPEFLKGFEEWARSKEDQLSAWTKVLTTFNSPVDLLLGLIVIAFIPAIGEEFVFRGIIQNETWRGTRNIHIAIWLSAFLFSAIHFQFYGFIPRLLLGALFGYLYYWSGNLLIPIFAHFFNNAFSVVSIYLYAQGITDTNLEDNYMAPWQFIIFSSLLTISLVYFIRKFYQQQNRQRAFAEHSELQL